MKAISGKKPAFFAAAIGIFFLCVPAMTMAQEKMTILFTSNLEGRYNLDVDKQDKTDPMLLMGQSVLSEAAKGINLYLDLGNAFYPGVLSKYNYGAAVMEYFDISNCASSLVSSQDLRLGVDVLELLQKDSPTKLLSANIIRDKNPVFQPYIIQKTKNHSVAFVGLSSKKVLFDIAEQSVYNIKLGDEKEIIKNTIDELKAKAVTSIVLVSGLEYQDNMELLNAFKDIDLIVAGGDNKGQVLNGKIVRMDTDDGRSIVMIPPDSGYCLLSLSLGKGIDIADINFKTPSYHKIDTDQYRSFVNRVLLYKEQFIQENQKVLIDLEGKTLSLDHDKVTNLLRDVYGAEISVIGKDAISKIQKSDSISSIDVLNAVNDNFTVYKYSIKGKDLLSVKDQLTNYIFTGIGEDKKVQGYAVDPKRLYRIVSTQTAYEKIKKIVSYDIPYTNTWVTLPDIISADLKENKTLLKDNYKYLDNRFNLLTDIILSFFYERAAIIMSSRSSSSSGSTIPVGEPSDSYSKWGGEGRIDFTVYNRLHKFILTPYINYTRQNDVLQNNLLRGTFIYSVNVSTIINPYHKLMVESVVMRVHGDSQPSSLSSPQEIWQMYKYTRMTRPVNLRETLGATLDVPHVSSKLGLGYEMHVHDPISPLVFGVEFSMKVTYDFLQYFNYTLRYDSFCSFLGESGKASNQEYLRSELNNKLSVKITESLRLAMSHRWYYYWYFNTNVRYSNSQFITSFDVVTDFKL